ncbi:hypothetical protein HD806DRAFT_548133 [Xylariaceae sp. AK1471]|nr:hypothetical protein HD806DRAFT_548133 [Xylariaceae sp. AK1471]
MSITFDQMPITTSQTEMAPIHDLLVGFETEPTQAVTQGPAFCQAMFFFHSCGCRTPEPIFCCQPYTYSSTLDPLDTNPCQHKNPAVVLAMLPHSCNSQIGNSEACATEDPGAREFVREADTAERLDLVVLDNCPQSDINTTLPAKVDVASTIDDVVSQYQRDKSRRRHKKAISATAAPFVPGLKARVAALPSPRPIGEILELAHETRNETETDEKFVAVEDTIDIAEQAQHGRNQPHQKESQQEDCVIVKETTPCEVLQSLEPESNNSESSDEFYDSELPASTLITTVNTEEPESLEGSYDDLLTFWALGDGVDEPNHRNTGYWGISSFLGRLGSRRS